MKKKWIICSGPDWYRPSVSSTEQLMRRFHADGYNVLWMNPVAFRSPFSGSATASSAWKKIRDKIRTHLRFVRRVEKNFWIWVPFYLPAFGRRFDQLNQMLIRIQLALVRRALLISLKNTIVWCAPGISSTHLLRLCCKTKIYEAHDLLSDFRTESVTLKKELAEKERMLCEQVCLIFAASENIQRKLQKLVPQKKIHLLLHGVDFRHFSVAKPLCEGILRIRSAGRPVAGYFGSLSDANDKQVFKALADSGFSVVIIGKVLGDYADLERNPNIYFIGPVDYEDLPSWAQGFDIGLLNWRAGEWIENCFPVKTLEYLAAGLPVVSCPIPVLQQHFADIISFAGTPAEFVEQCRKAVREDSEPARQHRRERVKDCSWDNRYRFVKELIDGLGVSTH